MLQARVELQNVSPENSKPIGIGSAILMAYRKKNQHCQSYCHKII
jgi:hypothetical protein